MRPVEVSNEAIIEAGEALQAAGRTVTGFAIRQRVGGGNPNRLAQVWREHINSKTATKAEPVAELPVEVAEVVGGVSKDLAARLMAVAVDLNDKAVKAAERRVAEVVRAAGEQREQAERELADATTTLEELEAKLEAAAERTREQDSALDQAHGEYQAQAVEFAKLSERLAQVDQASRAAAEQYAAELARTRHEVDQVREELTAAHRELAATKVRADAAEQLLAEQRKQAANELERSQKVLDQVREELTAAHRELASAKARADRLAEVQRELETARKEGAKALESAATARGQAETLHEQVGELTRALATVQAAGRSEQRAHTAAPADDKGSRGKK